MIKQIIKPSKTKETKRKINQQINNYWISKSTTQLNQNQSAKNKS
jgi:hypothetical protein